MLDVAIAGGGPAGLSAAIRLAQRGFRVVVFERQEAPADKACGEGLMPHGARELERLGVRALGMPFQGIRYVLEDGRRIEARFRNGSGIGVRRVALEEALAARAVECGATVRRASIASAQTEGGHIALATSDGPETARLLIAADGLHSPLRRAAGLEGKPSNTPQRFGLRRHFATAPWCDFVEVHWQEGCEAYVTPIGPRCVNVAFLCARGARYDDLLARFPSIRNRLGEPLSDARGAGPLLQPVRRRFAGRLALVGDAAGYVDAITGQGLSLAFFCARALAEALPQDLSQDLTPALRRYERALRPRFLHYALPARALLALARAPRLRSAAFRTAAALRLFPALVSLVG